MSWVSADTQQNKQQQKLRSTHKKYTTLLIGMDGGHTKHGTVAAAVRQRNKIDGFCSSLLLQRQRFTSLLHTYYTFNMIFEWIFFRNFSIFLSSHQRSVITIDLYTIFLEHNCKYYRFIGNFLCTFQITRPSTLQTLNTKPWWKCQNTLHTLKENSLWHTRVVNANNNNTHTEVSLVGSSILSVLERHS